MARATGHCCLRPQPPWGRGKDMLGMCFVKTTEPRLHSLPRAMAAWLLWLQGCGCSHRPSKDLAATSHSPLEADGRLHPGPGHGLPAVLDLGPGTGDT